MHPQPYPTHQHPEPALHLLGGIGSGSPAAPPADGSSPRPAPNSVVSAGPPTVAARSAIRTATYDPGQAFYLVTQASRIRGVVARGRLTGQGEAEPLCHNPLRVVGNRVVSASD